MRLGWPQILLLSTALHAVALLGFFTLTLPSASSSANPATPETIPSLSIELRSTTHFSHASSSTVVTTRTQSKTGLPVLKDGKTPTPAPVQPDSFALKSTNSGHVRLMEDPVLDPSPAPRVNSRNGVVFVLDISGSMYEPYAGSTRLALARQLLRDQIEHLADGAPFAITVYGETARRSGPLVPANAATRAAAVAYLNQEFDCGGGTNLPAGLDLAEELRPGALVLVTDGDLNMPSGELLPQVNRILPKPGASLAIFAVAPRANTPDRDLLQEIAEQEGGTCQTAATPENFAALVPKKDETDTP